MFDRRFTTTTLVCLSALSFACGTIPASGEDSGAVAEEPVLVADSFAYPISPTEFVTQAKDKKDEW